MGDAFERLGVAAGLGGDVGGAEFGKFVAGVDLVHGGELVHGALRVAVDVEIDAAQVIAGHDVGFVALVGPAVIRGRLADLARLLVGAGAGVVRLRRLARILTAVL